MKRPLPFFLIILLLASSLPAQNVQWASRVLDFSTEFGERQYGSKQILGKPDVFPAPRESPCAWSPLNKESPRDEFIQVAFDSPMRIRQVAVGESHNPGAVSRVYVYDTEGREYLVYHDDNVRPLKEKGRMLRIKMDQTEYRVRSVKVVLHTMGMPGWNHIDAIGISDGTADIEAKINLAENLHFDGEPENLGAAINSRYDEIMPIISPDGRTLYFDRKDHPNNTGGVVNDDIWMSTLNASGWWTRAVNVGSPLNNSGHNFLTAISPDGNTALLGNVYEADGSMSSGLSVAVRKADGWAFPRKLYIRDYYNNNKYSEFHMGANGKTILMTVDRRDSEGGKDLYVSFLLNDGTWTEPKNLGSNVNSAGTEMSPFLAADGKTLYFSSDGFAGYGSKDMYLARRLDDSWTNWTEPQNLGPVINSANWDAYYSIPADGEYAYFSSENNSLGKTDIFRIKLPQEMRPEPVVMVRGKVLDKETGEPVEARISYEHLDTGEEAGAATSSPTTGEYTIILPAGENYGFVANGGDAYLSVSENLNLTSLDEYKEVTKDLMLVPLKKGATITLNNIFFQPSKSTLSSHSYPELRRLARILKSNSNMKIEISGHTNNACSEEWCKKLSTDRAKSVYAFLRAEGIPPGQMVYKGYGSTRPLMSNDTAEGQRVNRRVEFTILAL